jgi:hypothetical protein
MFVGSAAAAANSIPFADSRAKPLMPPKLALHGSNASPELRAAAVALDDANERLKATGAEFKRVWDLNGKWEAEHPRPGGHRAHKKFVHRHNKYLCEIDYDAVFVAHAEARDAFKKAQTTVALLRARDINELALKGCMSFVYEDTRQSHLRHVDARIGQSVALELAFMAYRQAA